MKRAAALLLGLVAAQGPAALAATAYVTDELVLGVYADQSTLGPRLATLHSGAAVETLRAGGEATQVRLADGTTGWVKSAYLTNSVPAIVRVKQLQDELNRTRAGTPTPADPVLRNEVPRAPVSDRNGPAMAADGGMGVPAARRLWPWLVAVCCALCCGFWLGYAALARRVREKFGGIKVY